MKSYLMATVAIVATLSPDVAAQARQVPRPPQSDKVKIYVAPFTARGAVSPELLANFTGEFETTLGRSGHCYEVIERSDLDQLLKQIRTEKGFATIRDLGMSAPRVQGTGATAVIFGVINDDVNSGELVISAKMEYFDSRIAWTNEVSIPRGRRDDRSSRLEAIGRLAGSICGRSLVAAADSGKTGSPASDRSPGIGSLPNLISEVGGVQVGLQSCSASPSRVLCKFTVMSPGRDRKVTWAGKTSELYDQAGNTWNIRGAVLGNATTGGWDVDYMLIRNVPVQATITFPVSADIESIPLLKVLVAVDGWKEAEFRDIKPTRN